MKYESKRPSAKDPDVDVYLFAFGIEELRLLERITNHYKDAIPYTFETSPMINRLKEMHKNLKEFITKRTQEK